MVWDSLQSICQMDLVQVIAKNNKLMVKTVQCAFRGVDDIIVKVVMLFYSLMNQSVQQITDNKTSRDTYCASIWQISLVAWWNLTVNKIAHTVQSMMNQLMN